ncbi:MAG: glutathione peroxidase [Synergistaceae bacterium]|nr:glutathione peroxidase [Synergistaceae bacterium]
MPSVYDYSVKAPNGEEISLKGCEGKVMLIVNTATGCGFTPQYAPLEEMYKKYHDKGLEIIDIPCNQFGNQTPGTDEEVHTFCTLNYNTTFPQMKKSEVNGPNELPLYTFLKSQKGFAGFGTGEWADKLRDILPKIDPNYDETSDNIKWNFTKFVIDRKGNVVARFEPTADMAEVEKCVASLL